MQPSVGMRAGEPGAAPPLLEEAVPNPRRLEQLWRSFGKAAEWFPLPLRQHAPGEGEAVEQGFPADLHPELARRLQASGTHALSADARETFRRLASGFDVAVSGHALSRSNEGAELAVLDRATFDKRACSLHLCDSPVSALAAAERWRTVSQRLQVALCVTLLDERGAPRSFGSQADTARGEVVVTTLAGLESGLLPQHERRATLFAHLRHVLLDDIEQHRGLLGTRAAYLLHRLQRLALHHGAAPAFVASTGASNVDAAAHAERLVGKPFQSVRANCDGRLPAVVAARRPRANVLSDTVPVDGWLEQLQALVRHFREGCTSMLCIVPSRSDATRARKLMPKAAGAALRVCTPEEAQSFAPGSFDAVLTAAFPGNVSGLWQQLFLARPQTGLALWVPAQSPAERLFARCPLLLLDGKLEEPTFDPIHLPELLRQLPHAACELRIGESEGFGRVDGEATARVLERLVASGRVQALDGEERGYSATPESLPPLALDPELRPFSPRLKREVSVLLECERRLLGEDAAAQNHISFGEVMVQERSPASGVPNRFQSTAVWMTVAPAVSRALGTDRKGMRRLLDVLGGALLPFSALAAMASAHGVGFYEQSREDGEGLLFLYDRQVGGGGVSGRIFDCVPNLLRQLRHVTDHCGCEDGCASCIGSDSGRAQLMALLSELGIGANN